MRKFEEMSFGFKKKKVGSDTDTDNVSVTETKIRFHTIQHHHIFTNGEYPSVPTKINSDTGNSGSIGKAFGQISTFFNSDMTSGFVQKAKDYTRHYFSSIISKLSEKASKMASNMASDFASNLMSKLNNSTHHKRIIQTVNQNSAMFAITYSLIYIVGNIFGYYFWNVVRSAYKIIKEEKSEDRITKIVPGVKIVNENNAPLNEV